VYRESQDFKHFDSIVGRWLRGHFNFFQIYFLKFETGERPRGVVSILGTDSASCSPKEIIKKLKN